MVRSHLLPKKDNTGNWGENLYCCLWAATKAMFPSLCRHLLCWLQQLREGKTVLLPLVHLQPIETLISLHAIEDKGRKQVTSTCNYYVMQLE